MSVVESSPIGIAACRAYVEQLLFPEHSGSDRIGLELENYTYKKLGDHLVTVPLFGPDSLAEAIMAVAADRGGKANITDDGKLRSVDLPGGSRFLFEPGGQIEISTPACGSMITLEGNLRSMQEMLVQVTEKSGIQFGQSGTNPWFDAEQIGNQLPWQRYIAMKEYFDQIGPYGKQMMLQTCSMHINMEAGHDDETRIKRIVTANLLVPFATALFANSSLIGGKRTGHSSYRSVIWQHTDPLRTGILPVHQLRGNMDREMLIDMYLDLVLNAPVIFTSSSGYHPLPRHYDLKYWLQNPINGLLPCEKDLAQHVTLLFPEVRLKGYIEIRSVDAPPRAWQMIPVIFYSSLLYNSGNLDKTLDILLPYSTLLNELHKRSTYGLKDDLVYDLSKQLMHIALNSPETSTQLASFAERYTFARTCFADDNC